MNWYSAQRTSMHMNLSDAWDRIGKNPRNQSLYERAIKAFPENSQDLFNARRNGYMNLLEQDPTVYEEVVAFCPQLVHEPNVLSIMKNHQQG